VAGSPGRSAGFLLPAEHPIVAAIKEIAASIEKRASVFTIPGSRKTADTLLFVRNPGLLRSLPRSLARNLQRSTAFCYPYRLLVRPRS
jgi:hypothetical protein